MYYLVFHIKWLNVVQVLFSAYEIIVSLNLPYAHLIPVQLMLYK